MSAPVCNLPNIGSIPPPQAGIKIPSITRALDLPSAIQAINQISQIILQMFGQAPANNNVLPNTAQAQLQPLILLLNAAAARPGSPTAPAAVGGISGNKNQNQRPGSWQEIDRTTEKVKVVNPNDNSQWVIMERINALTFQNSITGEIWQWER